MAKDNEKAKPKRKNMLTAWRESMGYSMADAAEALGMPEPDLAKFEGQPGKPPKYLQLAMQALALGMTLDGGPDGEE